MVTNSNVAPRATKIHLALITGATAFSVFSFLFFTFMWPSDLMRLGIPAVWLCSLLAIELSALMEHSLWLVLRSNTIDVPQAFVAGAIAPFTLAQYCAR